MANVEVYKSSYMTVELVAGVGAAHVAVATGARWRCDGYGRTHQFAIAGTDNSNVHTPDDVMNGMMLSGQVLIYDDDHYYMGSVIAEKLVADGCQVVQVTPDPEVASWTYHTLEQHFIQSRLMAIGVEIIPSHRLREIAADSVTVSCCYTGAMRSLEVPSVIMVVSRVPDDTLCCELAARSGEVQQACIKTLKRIGDCHGPSTIAAAVYEGHRFARELGEEQSDMPFKREVVELAPLLKLPERRET